MEKPIHINWVNTLFLIFLPILAIIGVIWLALNHAISGYTILFTVILLIMGGLSITAGYHRLFCHLTYKAHWSVRLVTLLFGAITFEGSVLDWCTDHRNHHLYVDTPKDPYDITPGFWHAHIYWLFTLDPSKRDYSNVDDLRKDPLVRFQHRFYIPIAIFMGFLLPMLIAWTWGDLWGGLIIAGALRISIAQHVTFCVNSVCHTFGNQPYTDKNTARDNWFTALLTMGEGYHNFHHQFAADYRNGIRFYQFDPTKWLIRGLSYVGLTTELKKVSQYQIIKSRLEMGQKRLGDATNNTIMQPLQDALMRALAQLNDIEKRYQAMTNSKLAKQARKQLKAAKSDAKQLLNTWFRVAKNHAFA